MWQLALLSTDPIKPMKPYFPGRDIPGMTPAGKTYGKKLKDVPYSAELRKTIFECLYEMPANRPSLLTLRGRIEEAFKKARLESPDFKGEPWDDFEQPGPDTAEWDPDAHDDDSSGPEDSPPDDHSPGDDSPREHSRVRRNLVDHLMALEHKEQTLLNDIRAFRAKTPAIRNLLDAVLKSKEGRLEAMHQDLDIFREQQAYLETRIQSLKGKGVSTVSKQNYENVIGQKLRPQRFAIGLCVEPTTNAVAVLQTLLRAYDLLSENKTISHEQLGIETDLINGLRYTRNEIARFRMELARFDFPLTYVEPQSQTSHSSSSRATPPKPSQYASSPSLTSQKPTSDGTASNKVQTIHQIN